MIHWLEIAAQHRQAGRPFAIATVVGTVAPTSAKPGDKAIVTAEGELIGWIGGGCAQDVVIEEALECMQTGRVRLIRLSPDVAPAPNDSVKILAMKCESGGTLEVHIEPVLPKTKMLVFGASEVALSLVKLATELDYDIAFYAPDIGSADLPEGVSIFDNFDDVPRLDSNLPSVAIVATQGNGDARALQGAIASEARYITMVTSSRKAAKLFGSLEKRGVSSAALEKIKVPAGLDIKAETPAEIAVSVLAEIIQQSRTGEMSNTTKMTKPATDSEKVKDPICEMII
ncbi:MAG: XdhC family protein, partial [Candidatus Marinimicrobia bacterium]|nr:XdhC family protein [Candidatus Neomarinimicrobiota bacterium]